MRRFLNSWKALLATVIVSGLTLIAAMNWAYSAGTSFATIAPIVVAATIMVLAIVRLDRIGRGRQGSHADREETTNRR